MSLLIPLAWPNKALNPNSRWTEQEDNRLRELHGEKPLSEIGAELGRTRPSVRARITRLGISKQEFWPDGLITDLREAYAAAGDGPLDLSSLVARWGKPKANLCRKARQLGLGTNQRRRMVVERKDRRVFKGDSAALRASISQRVKEHIATNGHPRGMLGKKHTQEVRNLIALQSAARWEAMTLQERAAHTLKALKSKEARGVAIAPQIARGSWKAGWREIGGKRNYYRSRWEANYARWLQFLLERGDIKSWEHEPKTFWFEKILRGVRSYKPDFEVIDDEDHRTLHEVKGWMDARSVTTLKRMKKYYPDEIIILVQERRYKQLCKGFSGYLEGWE